MFKGTLRPTAADQRQIVQIAAIKYDTAKNEELEAFDLLVKPFFMPTVTDFFEELTGISQADIDTKGMTLTDALKRLEKFCNNTPILAFDQDWYVLSQNYGYLQQQNPFPEFTRVKALLPQWNIDPAQYSSGTLYQAADISMDGHVHNALHDVRSMAHAVSILNARRRND